MKKVQIDYELFRKLIFYHLGSDDQYEEDIRNGLEDKSIFTFLDLILPIMRAGFFFASPRIIARSKAKHNIP